MRWHPLGQQGMDTSAAPMRNRVDAKRMTDTGGVWGVKAHTHDQSKNERSRTGRAPNRWAAQPPGT